MADNINTGSGGNTTLALIVGGLVVAVILFFAFNGSFGTIDGGSTSHNVAVDIKAPKINTPSVPDAPSAPTTP